VAAIPSKTAVGFASLWTGAPPRVTGISGNRIPRTPAHQYTILESALGFSGAALRAEPLWNTAARAGLRVIALHAPLSGDKTAEGIYVQGYNRSLIHDGVIDSRKVRPKIAKDWQNLPPSNQAHLEIAFSIAASSFFGLLIDDPGDPAVGYDTLLVTSARDGLAVKTRLKSGLAKDTGTILWSGGVDVKTSDALATSYLRLFELKNDGRDYLLYFTAPSRDNTAPQEIAQEVKAIAGAFIGNGASLLYNQGALGTTIPQGGSGVAEARYLETVAFVQRHMMNTARWALQRPWDLLLAYTPYPDEAEHGWRGYLDPALPGYRPALAERLRPLLEEVYRMADEFLGLLLAQRPPNTIVALISDHGMAGVNRAVAINRVLQQNGLQTLDSQGRIDLQKTRAYYPSISNGYLLINSIERKNGIVNPADRPHVVREIQRALLALRDGDRPVVATIADAEVVGADLGIGGDYGGDIYLELMPGYDFDGTVNSGNPISQRNPLGNHGFNPQRSSMRTLMVLNGPGVQAGRRLEGVRLIDFAPTLARLIGMPAPKDATGRVIVEALSTLP
jgi:predicted AlkP superfamily phosphohydrolase/phosphomutase